MKINQEKLIAFLLVIMALPFSTLAQTVQKSYFDYLSEKVIDNCVTQPVYDRAGNPVSTDKIKDFIIQYDKDPEMSMVIASGFKGFTVLTCAGHELTHSQGTYYFDGESIPRQITEVKIVNQKNIYGDNVVGDKNVVDASKENWLVKYLFEISLSLVTLTLTIFAAFVIHKKGWNK